MDISRIMSSEPICCTPACTITAAAEMMDARDIGFLPVVDDAGLPLGVVTDRDLLCRVVARGIDPLTATVAACMSTPAVAIAIHDDVAGCTEAMRRHQVKRMLVTDDHGICCGVVSQADLAAHAPASLAAVAGSILAPAHAMA